MPISTLPITVIITVIILLLFLLLTLLPISVSNAFLFLLNVAIIFLIGNVWVYSVQRMVRYEPAYGQSYCNETLYLFSFWVITVSWVIAGLFCCCCCCLVLVAGCGMGLANAAGLNKQPRDFRSFSYTVRTGVSFLWPVSYGVASHGVLDLNQNIHQTVLQTNSTNILQTTCSQKQAVFFLLFSCFNQLGFFSIKLFLFRVNMLK